MIVSISSSIIPNLSLKATKPDPGAPEEVRVHISCLRAEREGTTVVMPYFSSLRSAAFAGLEGSCRLGQT